MKKINLLFFVFLIIQFTTSAQRYYGIASSNYAATNGLYINPANIADNRMLMDLNFSSLNLSANQNYGHVKNLRTLSNYIIDGTDLNFIRNNRIENVGFNLLGELRGPSFMMQLGKKEAIGLLTRVRIVGSGNGINTDYFSFLNDGIRGVKLGNGTTFTSGNVNTNVHAFTEIGIIYGREVVNDGKNYVKIGATLKRYNGLAYSSARLNNFSVKLIDTATSTVQFSGGLDVSQSAENFENTASKSILFGGAGSGIGIDIGALYEFRDAEEISTARYENKYKFKIGFALQDVGKVKYKTSPSNEHFKLNFPSPKTVGRVDTANIGFDDQASYFKSIGAFYTKDSLTTKIKAPTVFTLYGDYKISKHIYVNALFTGGLVGNKTNGTRTAFQTVVTPRFESIYFDAGLPISYNGLSQNIKVGLGVRLALFYLGTDDLISTVTGLTKFTSANIYFGMHAAIPYRKPRERKQKEEIPEVVKEKNISKDIDADGVLDDEDKCPTVAGLKMFDSCPDLDSDGIQDSEDKCPTIAGIKEFNGCADTDADGVQDSEDECPLVKGLPLLKGCADTDGDGVSDKNDKCVDKPGPVDNEGCPRVSEAASKKLNFAAQGIQFEVGKDIIRPISFKQLDEVVKIVNEYADYQLIIDGHTDNTGKADKNKILSEKRAAAIKNYFLKKGIDANRMIATGYGDTKPLVENNSVANKAKNRRVELNMILKE
jgi:outer membrane protein OmpA-like peptidoglycan-associated protein